MTQYVYSAWDGRQYSTVPSPDDILNALTDDLLRYGDLSWALEELLRRGYTAPDGEGSFQGFDALLRQLESAREACLQRYAADSFRLSARQVRQCQEQAQTAAQSATVRLDPFHDAFPAARTQRHVQEKALQQRYHWHDGQLYAHTRDLHPVILEETFKEAKRCRQQRITLNTFMLADDAPLIEFIQQLTAVSHGRAFYTTPERLGRYVIEDYLSNRKRRVA